MGRLHLSFLLLCSMHALACGQAPASISDGESSDIEEAVRAAVDAFAEAERERDVDAILKFIAPDFYMYADGTRVDYETVVEQIRATMPSLREFETTWSDIEVTALSRDHALATLIFRDVVTGGDGTTMRLRGPTTFVWRLRDGNWRLIYADADHYPDAP